LAARGKRIRFQEDLVGGVRKTGKSQKKRAAKHHQNSRANRLKPNASRRRLHVTPPFVHSPRPSALQFFVARNRFGGR
jgi:hypothetical protein